MKREVAETVYKVLVDFPETRNDDSILILRVAEQYVDTSMSFDSILRFHKELGIPSYESITRARRKCQELYDELKSDKQIAKLRKQEELAFREFAHEKEI